MATLHPITPDQLQDRIDAATFRIRQLRAEATRTLQTSPIQDESLSKLCGLIFAILATKDRQKVDQQRLSVIES